MSAFRIWKGAVYQVLSGGPISTLGVAVVPADVPAGEWALHLEDVTEGAAALQLPAVPPVVLPVAVAAAPVVEGEAE